MLDDCSNGDLLLLAGLGALKPRVPGELCGILGGVLLTLVWTFDILTEPGVLNSEPLEDGGLRPNDLLANEVIPALTGAGVLNPALLDDDRTLESRELAVDLLDESNPPDNGFCVFIAPLPSRLLDDP